MFHSHLLLCKWAKQTKKKNQAVGCRETLLSQLNIKKKRIHSDLKTKTGILDLEIKVISPRFSNNSVA